MIPTLDTWQAMVSNMGSTTVTFSPNLSPALWLHLIRVPFTPGLGISFTDATDLATFTGHTAKAIPAAARPVVSDPLTGGQALPFPPPAGGFFWECTASPTLPETIYGVALSDDSTTVEGVDLLASETLPEPVTITTAGDFVQFTDAFMRFNPALLS